MGRLFGCPFPHIQGKAFGAWRGSCSGMWQLSVSALMMATDQALRSFIDINALGLTCGAPLDYSAARLRSRNTRSKLAL